MNDENKIDIEENSNDVNPSTNVIEDIENINDVSESNIEEKSLTSTEQIEIDDSIPNTIIENIDNNISEKNGKKINIVCILIIVIILGIAGYFTYKIYFKNQPIKIEKNSQENNDNKVINNDSIEVANSEDFLKYRMTDNSLNNFDLYFLKSSNDEKNKVYSPLSIKYALAMLSEGATGETKNQIDNIIGQYNNKKYQNSSNTSIVNAMFIKDTFKNAIKGSYVNTLNDKYNAEIVYDSFDSNVRINKWVSDKTFKLINNLDLDVSDLDYVLINTLTIDQEWVKKIQAINRDDEYMVIYPHETTAVSYYEYGGEKHFRTYHEEIGLLIETGFLSINFNGKDDNAKTLEIGASVNKYDIINKLGKDNIRNNVDSKYREWLQNKECGEGLDYTYNKKVIDDYMDEISNNYKKIDSSTDFEFYVDDNVKVFAKDLKEYNGTTLQYIGIMPTHEKLSDFINNNDNTKITEIINKLKKIELDSFKDGQITKIKGYIPVFKFDYKMDNLINNLKSLGIVNVFEKDDALPNMTDSNSKLEKMIHQATIDFSNDGIKASAVTAGGGRGATGCYFDYLYDVPIEEIDLTFDKPYMFIIRDKNSGESWFVGTVYEPTKCANTGTKSCID